MTTRLRLLLLTAGIVALAGVGTRVPEALARVDYFEIHTVRVEGARWLTDLEAEVAVGLPPGTNLWEDSSPWVERLRAHPLVLEARARRRPPGTLLFEVRERQPVALLPTPALEPVDAEGRRLPIDPVAHRLDLPLLRPTAMPGRDGRPLTPIQLRTLTTELARLAEVEPGMVAGLSDIGMDEQGDVVARFVDPAIALHFRIPLATRRLKEGWTVLEDALQRRPGQPVQALDLRYADQVVVRFGRGDR
jgi:cell division septal protein FtsQ